MKEIPFPSICKWTQGYVCAVCVMINLDGQVETRTREMFSAGIGNMTLKYLKSAGVDEQDLKTLRKYWKQLHR